MPVRGEGRPLHTTIHNRLAALVRFRLRGLPELCSCVTNQTCASGCAIVSSAPKRTQKVARASLPRPLFNPHITTPRKLQRLQRNQPNQKPPNRKLRRGWRQSASLLGTSRAKRELSNREARAQMETATRVAGGDGEEVDEAEAARRLRSPELPAARWRMVNPWLTRRSKHWALPRRRRQRLRGLRRAS